MGFDADAEKDIGIGTDDQKNESAVNETPRSERFVGSVSRRSPLLRNIYSYTCIILLFFNFFLAQYDKFILAYFQESVQLDLSLSPTNYGLISGYATGIVYALLAIPIAYLADYSQARVWLLSIAATWWSLCVIFQGLANNFWQILLARIGMGIGQAAVEALSLSLISDLVSWKNVFIGQSIFFVGVYIGEAVSGQIATAFNKTDTSWQVALRIMGIVGVVIAILIRLVIREPPRQDALFRNIHAVRVGKDVVPWASDAEADVSNERISKVSARERWRVAKGHFLATLAYVLRMRSFWLLVLSAGFRQLAGNVFGFYMPNYLATTYSSEEDFLSRYGIIVGVVGSFSVLAGGIVTSLLWHKTKLTPIYITAIGGMVSSVFVLLMIFSRDIAGGDEDEGLTILYGVMSAAYLTAELWLGALFALVASLLPPRYKTFGLALWSSTQVLIYSTGPEIIGLILRNTDPASEEYRTTTKIALAVIIPTGYWLAGIGLLFTAPLLRRDLEKQDFGETSLSKRKIWGFRTFAFILTGLVISLFTVSIVYKA